MTRYALEANPELAHRMNEMIGGPALVDAMRANDMLRAAITYTLAHAKDGLEWLRAWTEGDAEAMAELDAHIAAAIRKRGMGDA